MTYPVERVQRLVAQAPTPAVGLDWTFTPTGLGAWRLLTLTALLTASAVVANRNVVFVADDQTTTWFRMPALVAQTAGQAVHYSMFDGAIGTSALAGDQLMPLPGGGLVLREGFRLRSITTGIDVGDQWSAIAGIVEELPSGKQFYVSPAGTFQVEEW